MNLQLSIYVVLGKPKLNKKERIVSNTQRFYSLYFLLIYLQNT